MNENIAQGKWKQVKGKIQSTWGDLTDDELEKTKGDLKTVAGLIRQKYGEAEEAVREKLNQVVGGLGMSSGDKNKGNTNTSTGDTGTSTGGSSGSGTKTNR